MRPITFTLPVAILALSLATTAPAAVPVLGAEQFGSPEQAIDALVSAVRNDDIAAFDKILGKGARALISSGDAVADAEGRKAFVDEYDGKHQLDRNGETVTLSVGNDDWPFPIPLRHEAAGWRFDLAVGLDELLNRRIGRNELDTQEVMLAYVDAQNDYATQFHDGLKLHAYAQKFMSSEGRQDGLYWPVEEGQPESPLGPLIAEAVAAGHRYGAAGAAPEPYHGYFYRILKSQGPHAPGGAYDYVANGVMIGGFALVAYPAKYGASGVKSFIINQDGVVYEKDLGPKTAEIAKAMTSFDPDPGWTKDEVP